MTFKPLLPADTIARNMADLHLPLRAQEAIVEADRCLYCFDAPCIAACPTGIDVPGFIKKIASRNEVGAARTILTANILGASCARVCPTKVLCEGACVLHDRDEKPIEIGRLQRFATDFVSERKISVLKPPTNQNGIAVAVIGAGPAGLGCAAELAQRLADAEDKLKKASKDVPKVVKPKESTKESTKEPKTKEPKTKEPKSPKTKESIPPVTKTVTVASTEEDVFAGVVVPGAAELDAHEARPYTASDAVVFKHGKKTYMKMPTGALFKMGETKGELGEAAGYWDEASSSIVQEEPFGSV